MQLIILRKCLFFLVLLCLGKVNSYADGTEVRIGVLAIHGIEYAQTAWDPTANYLNKAVPGFKFKIIPLEQPGLLKALQSGALEFVLTNTGNYVELEALHGITRIATLVNKHEALGLTQFGAVIFTRANNQEIKTLKDLKNRSLLAVHPDAFGGFRMAWAELLRHGVNPHKDLSRLEFSGFPVERIAYAVQEGRFEVGTFRTGVLERLHREGKIDLSKFRVLNLKNHSHFPLLLSTELYPEWPFARTKNATAELTEKVTIALLKLTEHSKPAIQAGIHGFTVPLDYQKVHELYKRLRVDPYQELGKVRLEDILLQYWPVVLTLSVVFVFMGGILLYIVKLARRLGQSESRLERAQKIAHIGNWDWTVDQNQMNCSTEAFHIIGLPDRQVPIAIDQFLETAHRDDREVFKQCLNDALYRGKILKVDHRIVLPDGSIRVVHQQAERRVNERGKVIGMSGIVQDITERKSVENRLRESQQELASILNNMQDTFFRINFNGRVVSISPSVSQLLRYEVNQIVGRRFIRFLVHPKQYRDFNEALKTHGGRVDNFELKLRRRDNTIITAAASGHPFMDEFGQVVGIEGIARDISELAKTRDDLASEKERMQITVESIGDGVITTDIAGRVEFMNRAAEQITAWALKEAQGQPLFTVLNVRTSQAGESIDEGFQRILESPKNRIAAFHEAVLINQKHNKLYLELTLASIRDHSAQVCGGVIVFHDATKTQELARKIAYQATHDPLTGLINRREFEVRLEHLLKPEQQHSPNAVLYIDLDQFKQVNETCGHLVGDEMLKQVADQLRAKVRKPDTLARIGGDEFALLLNDSPLERSIAMAESLISVAREFQFLWGDRIFDVALNIGILQINADLLSVHDVLNGADIACYNARLQGKNTYSVYQPDSLWLAQRTLEK